MKTYVPLKRTHFFKLEETKKKQGPLTKYRAQLIHLACTAAPQRQFVGKRKFFRNPRG
jgi:hypothetical protein